MATTRTRNAPAARLLPGDTTLSPHERLFGLEHDRDPRDARTPFDRDRDRIVHSRAWRRLSTKTQVFGREHGDDLRTRASHSLEVSLLARSLAQRFGLPEALLEAVALAHDIGHPPFAHVGEHALHRLMAGEGGFRSNAQTFRVLTRLEEKSADYPGLNLTRATLVGVIKYPQRPEAGEVEYLYGDDADDYETWLYGAPALGTAERPAVAQSVPCQIMDWSDDASYATADFEDSVLVGMITPAVLRDADFAARVGERLVVKLGPLAPGRRELGVTLRRLARALEGMGAGPRSRVLLREVSRVEIQLFACSPAMRGRGASRHLVVPDEARVRCETLKQISWIAAITHPARQRADERQREMIERVFAAALRDVGDGPDGARLACDRVASMSEGELMWRAERLAEADR